MEIVLENVDCWNVWVLVRINPGRAGDSVGRPPKDVLVLLGFVKPLSGRDYVPMLRDAFACGVLVLAMRRY